VARLLLVRHGETEGNSSQRYWGKTDVGLGAIGLRQAELLRDRLGAEKINHVYSSKMQRTMLTARTIASIHHLPVEACPEINEIDFGDMEGLNFSEIHSRFPEVARMWIERSPDLAYPHGESLAQMETRVAEFRKRMLKHAGGKTVLIVAHAGILRSLICQLLELELCHRWNFRVELASLSILETFPEIAVLSLFNDTSHLTHSGEYDL
jgi:alpha-ribazole phosphatase